MAEDDTLTPQGLMRWIVRSLYEDEAIPRGTVLQWYWQLLTGEKLTQQQLVRLIDSTPGVYLDPPCKNCNPFCKKDMTFRALLKEPPPNFRGFIQEEIDPEELVSLEIWEDIQGLLAQGGWPKITNPGYRKVSLAAWLQDRTEALSGVTFGRLLQVIGVAISGSSKLLGNREGALVPYKESEEYEKFANAKAGKPTGVKSNELYIQTWDELTYSLRELITASPNYEIEISQIKAQCRAKLRKELSETAFGHHSLLRLLEDPRISEYIERYGDPITRPCIRMRKSATFRSKKAATRKGAAEAVAKPGSEELVEAEIRLANDRKVTLKVFFMEELAEAVERFCKENGLEEHHSKVLSWLEKQVVDPKGSSTLKVDMKTIASGN